MVKKILGFIAVLLIAFVAMWNVNVNSQTKGMSDVMLANVEALANDEGGGGQRVSCYNKIEGFQGAPMEDQTYCGTCKAKPAMKWSDSSECTR